ncbi:MAG TPA: antibiotic ABC transporter ATP-binding protein [Flavobacteriaceae bacterium]|nr:antibiotic ABC transporter ATP-binding protein [Flavobacteriaceae bacterium]
MAKSNGSAFDFKLFMRLLTFTRPYRGTFIFVAFAAVGLSVAGLLGPIFLKNTIDLGMLPRDYDLMLFYISLIVVALILEVVFQFSFIYYANWLGQTVIRDLRIKLFDKMMRFKMAYFDKSAVGRLTTRTVNDIETIASIFSEGMFTIASDVLKMLVIAVYMLYESWQLALISFSILPILLYATRVFQRAMKGAFEDVRNQVANLNTFVQERITGMKIVQIFVREQTEYDTFVAINKEHRKGWIKTVWYNSIFFPIAEISGSVALGLIVWYGGMNVVPEEALKDSGMTLGLITAFVQLSQMLFRPLRMIADKFNTLQMGMVAANRVFEILDTQAHIQDQGSHAPEHIKGDIEFKGVRFGYIPEEPVIKDISFSVEAGQTIALVGATGAGKSTIINLLTRFYEINQGQIDIDGVGISEFSLAGLRSHIAVVLQDVFLFADTILHNITLGDPEITEAMVVAAAKEIGVHDFISSLPGGYHYNVKERGTTLSSGQRQLIAFLRAFVSKPSILILDEATSSVDSYSEELIQNATDRITRGRTSIVIAHRLATIQKADQILVMEQGQIIERGRHSELIKKDQGHYKSLYEVQFLAEPDTVS